MKVESRVTDIARELQIKSNASAAASRLGQVASDRDGDSTRKPIKVQKISASDGEIKAKALKVPAQNTFDVHKAAEKLNNLARSLQRDVSFSVNKEAKATVIKVFKSETGELIKQFPPDEILAMIVRLRKNIGLLVDKKM